MWWRRIEIKFRRFAISCDQLHARQWVLAFFSPEIHTNVFEGNRACEFAFFLFVKKFESPYVGKLQTKEKLKFRVYLADGHRVRVCVRRLMGHRRVTESNRIFKNNPVIAAGTGERK